MLIARHAPAGQSGGQRFNDRPGVAYDRTGMLFGCIEWLHVDLDQVPPRAVDEQS